MKAVEIVPCIFILEILSQYNTLGIVTSREWTLCCLIYLEIGNTGDN